MIRNFQLGTDPKEINKISSTRLYVAVPLLFAYTVLSLAIQIHYLFHALLLIKGQTSKKLKLQDHGRRLILYGVAALLSMNFLQYSIFMPILAWISLVTILINHSAIFVKEAKNSVSNYLLLAEYIALMIWYFGIMVFYIYSLYI